MAGFTPTLNLQARKQKGLIKLFGGTVAPWYFTTQVVKEGTPMKLDPTTAGLVLPCGTTDGALCIGLATQETYDESAFGQLKGYHFANDTRQRLNGEPIGILMGAGWALTNYWVGSAPAYGTQAYLTASGMTATPGASGAALPIIFEGAADPALVPNLPVGSVAMVRIRYQFNMAIVPA